MKFGRYDEVRTKLSVGMTPSIISFFLWSFTPLGDWINEWVFIIVQIILIFGGMAWSLMSLNKE